MAETIVGIKLNASVSGAEQVKKLKEEIKAAEAEAKKIAKEFGESSKEAQAAAEKVTKLAQGLDSFKSIKTQIREATQEAARLSQQFGEFSPEAAAAAQRVAGLKDQMDDLNEKIQALHPDKFNRINTIAKGVANGFQAAQGAMALFGAESEDVQKALLKVQGAMAFAQGLEGLDAAGKQLKTLGMRGIEAFKGMTTASKVFMATGLGLLLTGLATVAAYWDDIKIALGLAKSEMDKMNAAMKVAEGLTRQQAADLQYYNKIVQDTKKSETERKGALDKLKEAGIATDDVNIANANSLEQLNIRTQKQILLIAQRARTEAASQILQEKTKRLLELQTGDLDEQTSSWDKFYAGAVGALTGINNGAQELAKRGFANLKEAQKDVNDSTKVYNNERNKQLVLHGQSIATAEEVKSTLEKQTKAQKELNKAQEPTKAEKLKAQLKLRNSILSESFKLAEKSTKESEERKATFERNAREVRIERAFQDIEDYKKKVEEEVKLEEEAAKKKEEIRLKEIQDKKDAEAQMVALTAGGFGAIAELADAFAGKSEEQQRKAFEIKKKASIAQAIVETIQAAQSAYASQMAITTPDAPVRAAIAAALAIASGVARVRKIEQTQFESKDIGGGGGATGTPAQSPGAMTPLTGGALPEEGQFGGMGRVYVLEGDITKTQTRVRRLRNTSVV
jgi:hypothetical protein